MTYQRCGCDLSVGLNLWDCSGMTDVELARNNSIVGISCSIHKLACQMTVRKCQTVNEYLS